MKNRVAIVSGLRSPFCKAGGVFRNISADDLAAFVASELVARASFEPSLIDEVIIGNVIQPPTSSNIARVIAGKAGLPDSIPAYTVGRNCASGMEAVASASNKILLDQAEIILAGGVESMSNFPILFSDKMRDFLVRMNRSKTFWDKLRNFFTFRPDLLKPEIPGLDDPLCGLSMGQTAEKIIREFKVSRLEQDQFALESQLRAAAATKKLRFQEEIVPIPLMPDFKKVQQLDDGIRNDQTLEALQKLKPSFDPLNGSVTAGNSSQLTDGAALLFLMSERKAKELGLKPLGYLLAHAAVGVDPSRMGLGPVYATAKLFKKTGMTLDQIDLIEINEAFAGQVLAVMKAFSSEKFALGTIDHQKLNVNGGAIALGHPLGASGARLILTLLLELKHRGKRLGLATLCVGGGQGQACLLEASGE